MMEAFRGYMEPSGRKLYRRVWDVVVVGAGPAGSCAALHLARMGHEVLLVDRTRFPRDKTCGDALIADALQCLRRAGVAETVTRWAGSAMDAALVSPKGMRVAVPLAAIALERLKLDGVLALEAMNSGTTMLTRRVLDIVEGPRETQIICDQHVLRSRFTIVATGAAQTLPSRIGAVHPQPPDAVAVRQYVNSTYPVRELVLSGDPSVFPGYGWIFPVGANRYNVGIGARLAVIRRRGLTPAQILRRFVREFPLARALYEHANAIAPAVGAPLRLGLGVQHTRMHKRVVTIGEALGTTFPCTGEGIGKAMETGEIAAQAIHEGLAGGSEPVSAAYARIRLQLYPRYRAYEIGERWLSNAFIANIFGWAAMRSPSTAALVGAVLNEQANPSALFCLGQLTRMISGR